jgi:predicted CXXCH cytochrome family protein
MGLSALLAAWAGCTVTEKNYEVLSFFFDGVPPPEAPGRPGAAGATLSVNSFLHKPYAEENCDACHAGRMRLTRRDSDVCMGCHAGVQTAHARMHGPVAAGACLWCHAPHESAHAPLLRGPDRDVCAKCHTPALLDATGVEAHADRTRSCLECHMGHGGEEPYMLRAVLRQAAPATPDPPPPRPDR